MASRFEPFRVIISEYSHQSATWPVGSGVLPCWWSPAGASLVEVEYYSFVGHGDAGENVHSFVVTQSGSGWQASERERRVMKTINRCLSRR